VAMAEAYRKLTEAEDAVLTRVEVSDAYDGVELYILEDQNKLTVSLVMTVAVSVSLYGCFLHQLFNFTDTYDLRLTGNLRHAGSGQIYDSIDADILLFQEEEVEVVTNDTTYIEEEDHITEVIAPMENEFVVPTSDLFIKTERDNGALMNTKTFTPLDGEYMLMTTCGYYEDTQQLKTVREEKVPSDGVTKYIETDGFRGLPYGSSIMHGAAYEYYSNGNMQTEFNAIDGESNGYQRSYYENGGLKSVVIFVDGEKDGRGFYYMDDGRLRSHTDYLKGEYILRVTYNPDGSIDEIEEFE